MGMVASEQRIASAFFVLCGKYGDVSRYAQERGVCRQWIYREAASLRQALTTTQQQVEELLEQLRQEREQRAELETRLAQAVVIDAEKQEQLACVAQARGVTLRDCRELMDVLIPGQALSLATLGRRTQAAGKRAGALLAVLDEAAQHQAREVAADEIYVKAPVLMVDQGDHFHALWGGSVGLNKAQRQASKALAAAEAVQKEADDRARHGKSRMALSSRVRHAWKHAEEAMDAWQEREQAWQKIKQALQLVTPEGELNTRAQAEPVLAATLPQLPDSDFAKTKRQLQEAEMLNYLDRVHDKIAALPFAQEVKEAAVRQESLRRRPEALQGETPQAAALRGVLRMHQAGHRRMTQGLLDLKRLHWNSHTFGAGRRRKTTPYERLGVPWPPGMRWWDVLKLTPEQLRDKLSTTKMAA